MIASLTFLLAFQAAGELLSKLWLPGIPGPVIGLCLLLIFLMIKGTVPASLERVSEVFTANLGLLFVPAAVGVVVFWPLLSEVGWQILLILSVSVVAVLALTAWLLDRLATALGLEQKTVDKGEESS